MAPNNYKKSSAAFLCLLVLVSCISPSSSQSASTITQGQVLRDGETIISAGQRFVFGFFSPENSTSRYAGIWYSNVSVQSVVWVANRENPISGETGSVTVGSNGNLMVLDGNTTVVWSTNLTNVSTNATATLLDSGDLLLTPAAEAGDMSEALWKSFSDPTDTFLPDMRVYMNTSNKEGRLFRSWTSPSDPSPGNYSMAIDPRVAPQIVIWDQNMNRLWRSGHWDGLIFIGIPGMRAMVLFGFRLTRERDGATYFTYSAINNSQIIKFRLGWDGIVRQLLWNEGRQEWNVTQAQPSANRCDRYNRCGNFAKCNGENDPICTCIQGFNPTDTNQWSNGNWSGGCRRRTPLQCQRDFTSDGFRELERVKLPDYADAIAANDKDECKERCLRNCSCHAFAYLTGNCMVWSGALVDVEQFADGGGHTLYIRLADSELGGKKLSKGAIAGIIVAGVVFLAVIVFTIWKFRAKWQGSSSKASGAPAADTSKSKEFSSEFSGPGDLVIDGKQGSRPELPLFSLNAIVAATDDFANKNKLGQGGFGPVFKGTLPGGQEIAVKRLSKLSGQGVEEFKTEIILIAKLQHRNLVRLLGCCVEGEEKMLIYEYMQNKSLDFFLFGDAILKAELDWKRRLTIIKGVARGLLYLHRDSRLRIIHRDLKASNILLDDEMTPKISDFGMARIFGGNQNEASTNRIVGTYGYMSPEYAMEGLFSEKSDVYSFGVLTLEIVSGRRNTTKHPPEHLNLIGHAWKLLNDGKTIELLDPTIKHSSSQDEVLRCINIGLLCVQDNADHRPTMASAVLWLESEDVTLPVPKQPNFNSFHSTDTSIGVDGVDNVSSNSVTITALNAR